MRIGQPVTLTADVYGSKVCTTAGRWVLGRHRRGVRRSCPRRTRPATGSRSCSACRCASRSTRRNWTQHPLRIGLSMKAEVESRATNRHPARHRADDVVSHGRVQQVRRRSRCGDRPHHRAEHAGAAVGAQSSMSRTAKRRCIEADVSVATTTQVISHVSATTSFIRRSNGAQARARHDRGCARGVHERARLVDCERLDSDDFGRSRRLRRPGHVGHHARSPSRTRSPMPLTGWLTQRFGQVTPVRLVDPAVRDLVVAVRHRAVAAVPARRARARRARSRGR